MLYISVLEIQGLERPSEELAKQLPLDILGHTPVRGKFSSLNYFISISNFNLIVS